MLPDRVSDSGPLTYESGALPTALCGPAKYKCTIQLFNHIISKLSIEKHQLIMKCGFREQGICREKKSVIYYLGHITLFVCPQY